MLKAAQAASLDDDDDEPEEELTFEEYKKREIEKMKAEGWIVEGEEGPPGAGGPPKKAAPPPPPRTSIPGMFSKVEYDTSHMWGATPEAQPEEEEPQEEEIKLDFTGTKVAEKYEILEQIGSGVSSIVHKAKLKAGGSEFTLKAVTPETNSFISVPAKQTGKNLKACQHPSVVKLVEEFQEGDNLYLILEKLPGTAASVLSKSGQTWTQKQACTVLTQILQAVAHIHSKGLTHGDLSHSNILAGDASVSSVKVGGFSKCLTGETDNDLFCESGFKAPEVVDRKKHGQAVDLWSVGCLAFLFLSGKLPFKDNNNVRLNANIRKGSYTMDSEWDAIDEKAKDFVKKLLVVDPATRPTAAQALEHPWIKSGGSDGEVKGFAKNLLATLS